MGWSNCRIGQGKKVWEFDENPSQSTTDISLLKKQSLGATGGIGLETQRKKFGFFAELTAGLNFSGIYDSNASSSSGARGKTEAYFRTAGLRVGVRFW